MRRLLGLLLVLYSLVLAMNTTLPALAEILGDKVTATSASDSPNCSTGLGSPPYLGLPDSCQMSWTGGTSSEGRLNGVTLKDVVGEVPNPLRADITAYQLPFLSGYAYIPVAGTVGFVLAGLAVILFFLGLGWLFVAGSAAAVVSHGYGGDSDSDSDYDSGDSDSGGGDSGGGDGGGGGD